MFSNEFEPECTVTTILDETGEHQDVQLVIHNDGVYIRQYTESETVDVIWLTHKMFKDMIEAMGYPEGFYQTRYKR